MARIRSVHPGLWTDDAFVSVSAAARLLFIGLWNECDDQGAFRWNPTTLKIRLAPVDNVDVRALLRELTGVNLIRPYGSGGVEYGAVRNFTEWQRPKKPTIVHPMPPDLRTYAGSKAESGEPGPLTEDENGELDLISSGPSGELPPRINGPGGELRIVNGERHPPLSVSGGEKPPQGGKGRKKEGREEKVESLASLARPKIADDPDFNRFWAAYPRKDDKGHARKAWKTALSKATANAIIEGLGRARFSDDPKFRPLAATWLNGERWGDAPVNGHAGLPLDGPEPENWVQSWIARKVTERGCRTGSGELEPAISGYMANDLIDDLFRTVTLAGGKFTEPANLDPLLAWCRDDWPGHRDFDHIIERVTRGLREPIRSLAVFDAALREAVGR